MASPPRAKGSNTGSPTAATQPDLIAAPVLDHEDDKDSAYGDDGFVVFLIDYKTLCSYFGYAASAPPHPYPPASSSTAP
jgi:hypothetical protein